MFKSMLFAVALCIFASAVVSAQSAPDQRTQDLVASLDKTKYKKKDKGLVSVEVFADIKNRAVVKNDPSEYSGRYLADDYELDLSVNRDGSATGTGYDSSVSGSGRTNFTLRNARVSGALLTATKVYDSGVEIPFEAVFVDRTSVSGKNPNDISDRSTAFGIGFVQSGDSGWTNRVFLEKK
jgi:hypothetical protein